MRSRSARLALLLTLAVVLFGGCAATTPPTIGPAPTSSPVIASAPRSSAPPASPTIDPVRLGICTQVGGLKPCPSFGSPALATGAPSPTPSPFLADPAARVTALMTNLPRGVGQPGSPGCAVAISQDGKLAFAQGFGSSDLTSDALMTPDTVFDAASISKEFTAASILLLAQDGKLALSDEVHRHLPELPAWQAPVTIEELLHHTSGLPDLSELFALGGLGDPATATADDMLPGLMKVTTFDTVPGQRYLYNDTGYDVLRLIVERVSGERLEDFIKTRIFEPLGMTASSFSRETMSRLPNKATPYSPGSGSKPWLPQDVNLAYDFGATGLQTTVLDLQRWAANFTTGTVGGPAFLKAQLQPGPVPVDDYEFPTTYLAGLFFWSEGGHQLIFHSGAAIDSGFRSQIEIDPVDHVAVAMGCNTNAVTAYTLGFQILDAWLGTDSATP